MVGLARYALPGIIVLTSLGAFLMCLLVIRYGFGSREMELDAEEARRLVMTRIGHAMAAVCFAGAALLALIALPASIRSWAPLVAASALAPPPSAVAPAAMLDEQAREIARLRDAIHQTQLEMDDKLAAVESRLANLAGRLSSEPPAAEPARRSARPPDQRSSSGEARAERSARVAEPPHAAEPTAGATARRFDDGDGAYALPAGATAHNFHTRVQGVSVDVQTRQIRKNETAYLVRLQDEAHRPITSADVTLVGTRGDGTPLLATLEPTSEPAVHRGRVATTGSGADLRLRVVGPHTRFEVSLAREVSW